MSKRKVMLLVSLAAMVIAAAIALGIAGCAGKSQPASSSNPPVTTYNGQTGGQPSGQSGQPNGSHGTFNPQQMQANITQALAGLVSNGTITQAQSNSVLQAYTQAFANRQQGWPSQVQDSQVQDSQVRPSQVQDSQVQAIRVTVRDRTPS